MANEKCRVCLERYSMAGDGWDGMCPTCADAANAGRLVDPEDFPSFDVETLEDDSDAYNAEPGTVFGGTMNAFGTYMHISLIWCEFTAERKVLAKHPDLQRLVAAALDADPDAYRVDCAEPKWVVLEEWPGRKYLLACAPGAAT